MVKRGVVMIFDRTVCTGLLARLTVVLALMFLVASCSDDSVTNGKSDQSESRRLADTETMSAGKTAPTHTLTVYKTPSCGCCNDWVSHIKSEGFGADVVNQDTVAHIKDLYGIPTTVRSCHTAVSDNNFVFEGHVPAKYIDAFLSAPPAGSKGLVVPAMPLGSPGMELEDKFQAYTIYALKDNGGLAIYQKVDSYQQQF
jgi:hypothetical protein